MVNKQVTIQVGTNVDLSQVHTLEQLLNKVGNTTVDIDVKQQELIDAENHLKELKSWAENSDINLDVEIAEAEADIKRIKEKLGQVDDEPITPKVDNLQAMEAIENIGGGFDRLKQGASEIAQQMGDILEKTGEAEQNQAFLEIGYRKSGKSEKEAEKLGKEAQQTIQRYVQKAPGDDTAMNSILSSAVAKDVSLLDKDMEGFANSVSDYFAGARVNGKLAAEAIQDVRSYINSGNVAELETTGIFDAEQLEQLKDIDSVGDRVAKFQEMVDQSSYAGLGTADTLTNKFAEFDGMMDASKTKVGDLFSEGLKGAMDFALTLNDDTNGLLGMGLAVIQMATPLTDAVMGLGQMATGLKAIGDVVSLDKIRDKFSGVADKIGTVKTKALDLASSLKSNLISAFDTLKTKMTTSVIPALKNAGTSLLNLGKSALTAGLNALRSAGAWLVAKAQLVVSTVATWAQTVANWALNSSLLANPITWIVIAIIALAVALIWAYNNVDWFREMVDNAWASLVQFGQQIYGAVAGALQWLGDLFSQFTSQIGLNTNDWIQAIIGFILFIPQLPLQLGVALVNAIAHLFGFKGNFVQTMLQTGINAVSNFINQISQLPGKLASELQRMYSTVSEWASTLPQKFWDAGVNAVKNFLNALGIHSPGFMFNAISGELNRIDKVTAETDFSNNISEMASNMASNFNPNLTANGNNATGVAGGDVIINVYGDIDNEQRIKQIVDAVRKELSWNNTTAGRTV